MNIIATLHNDFPTKFGLPRQSGLAEGLISFIVFEKEYRAPEALRGLEGFSHLWLIWQFHAAKMEKWSPTVRPPRLGGNTRMGVFATRSPFRPNPIGLSCVKLEEIRETKEYGWVLVVSGADLMDGTPIYDIKPYLPFADCHPEATGGFAAEHEKDGVEVVFPEALLCRVPADKQAALLSALRQDPRPAYHHDKNRLYGFSYAGLEIRFCVDGSRLTVCQVEKIAE